MCLHGLVAVNYHWKFLMLHSSPVLTTSTSVVGFWAAGSEADSNENRDISSVTFSIQGKPMNIMVVFEGDCAGN